MDEIDKKPPEENEEKEEEGFGIKLRGQGLSRLDGY